MADIDQSGSQDGAPIDARAFFTAARPSRAERRAMGQARRSEVPLSSHAATPTNRADPVALLRGQEASREPDLIGLRYERMGADPFAFLRGAAAVMAADLDTVPSSGIAVQLCGDAHLANFGMFASAERSLVFDLNDFDETLPGPFEWDVKRLAASFVVAAHSNGFSDKQARKAARVAVQSYRTTMAKLATMGTLDVWYARIDVDAMALRLRKSSLGKATAKASRKSRTRTGDSAVLKLTEVVDGQSRFRSEPPLLVPVPNSKMDEVIAEVAPIYAQYLATLPADRVSLLIRYSFLDLARKVVGVGSVGTRALVMLLASGDGDQLVLQIKQANTSVLAPYLGASRFDNEGKRVVIGQRVLQATGDPFLGWCRGGEDAPFDFYVRQLRDMKGGIEASELDVEGLNDYGLVCGAVLARAHARAGDAAMISGYLGEDDQFDQAVADFAVAYASITDQDHAALVAAGIS